MEININESQCSLPVQRGHVLSMTIKSFKGRRDVEVHLFRSQWDPAEIQGYDWPSLLGEPLDPNSQADPDGSKHVVLESFTREERDKILEYLKKHYASRLDRIDSQALEFPVPIGLTPLSSISEGKSVGFIRFEKIPHYDLELPLRGLYDLSRHKPIVDVEEERGDSA